jgi:hypothetical protein
MSRGETQLFMVHRLLFILSLTQPQNPPKVINTELSRFVFTNEFTICFGYYE